MATKINIQELNVLFKSLNLNDLNSLLLLKNHQENIEGLFLHLIEMQKQSFNILEAKKVPLKIILKQLKMKALTFIILIFLLIPIGSFSQRASLNLIENSGFEHSDLTKVVLYKNTHSAVSYVAESSEDFEKRCFGWLAPWASKPGIVDSAAGQVINGKTYDKVLVADKGRRFIQLMLHGRWVTHIPLYRDYIGQKLKAPLKKGILYKVEVDAARTSWVAINKLGFFFTEKPVQKNVGKDWQEQPIRPQVVFDSILCKIPMTWYKLSATFQLNKDAEYLYFGNFAASGEYQTIFNSFSDAWVKKTQACQYYFDNFSVVEVPVTETAIQSPVVTKLPFAKLNETILLSNVSFNTNQAQLKATHLLELDELCDRMFQNPSWTVRITGHTDNVGSVAQNQQLSENRANTIAEYLQNKGIDAKRIQKRGVGATQPIADNQTIEGREKNRRVEIEINQ
jgi:outer membrane protein OmpA-like peptidoglycan-associated protein